MKPRTYLPIVVLAAIFTAELTLPRLLAAPAKPPRQLPRPPQEGFISYECRDGDKDQLTPCKLTILGVDGTRDPEFTHNDIGRQEGEAIASYNRVMSLSGVGFVRVPPGSYDVYASHGPEWDLAVTRKLRVTGAGNEVRATLHHVIDTTGWLSGDFHVHAASSPDSRVPMADRIYEFVSDGVDLIVSTDHNVVSDYAPIIAELGAGQLITSLRGDELTTNGWGHHGVFPLPQTLEKAGHGAVLVHGRNAREMFADVRQNEPDAVIDIHHPRVDPEIGYFTSSRFDAASDTAGRPGFSLDADAIEVLNGYQDSERRSVDRVIHDWFELLDHGHILTATGNSDTHHLTYNLGGYPRNYLRIQDDRPSHVTAGEITKAIKGHHAFFTTAPFVRFHVGDGDIGDLALAKGGKVHAAIEVDAAPWVSVSSVVLYVNGVEVKRWTVPPGTDTVRFKDGFDFTVTRDSWAVVRVDGDKPLSPVIGDMHHFDVRPLALTNPVFLDFDGNGVYDPPHPHGPHDQQAAPQPLRPRPTGWHVRSVDHPEHK